MSTEQREGPHIPQTVDGTPELYRLLRQRIKDVGIEILKTPPKPYEHNDEAHQSKEALKQWAKNVGADKGVMEILEEIGGDLKEEMYNDLWDLHQVMEDIEIKVGSRRIRSDGTRPRSEPFQHFNRLLYTFNLKATKFSDLAASHPHYRTSTSTPTPPASDLRNPFDRVNCSPIPSTTHSEELDRIDGDASNQSHLRNDSHSAYIKREDPSPLQRDYSAISSPLLSYDTRMGRSDARVKMEDTQPDDLRQTGPVPFTPSVSMSPKISDPTPIFSPTGSSPNATELWSPHTPINSTLSYPSSSLEERKRAHDVWASTALRDEQPVVMHTRIPPDPSFPPVSQLQSVNNPFPTILSPPGASSLATTPPRPSFYPSHDYRSSSSPPPVRRPDL